MGREFSPTFQPSKQYKSHASFQDWRNYERIRAARVFQSPQLPNKKKKKNLQLIAERKLGRSKPQNTIEKGQMTKSYKTQIYQEQSLMDENRRTSSLSNRNSNEKLEK